MKIYKKDWSFLREYGITVCPHWVTGMQEHLHEFVELVYIMDGSGVHRIDGVDYAVKRGALLFINYRQVHGMQSESGMEIWDILIDPERFSEKLIDPENAFELLTLSGFSAF